MNEPFITPIYFRPDQLDMSTEQFYRTTKTRVLQTSEFKFADQTLPHQVAHSAFRLGRQGIRPLNLPGGAPVIIDAWDSQHNADEIMDSQIRPALGHAPEPELIAGIEPIGIVCNPDLSQFNTGTAVSNILLWHDLEVDPRKVNQATAKKLYSRGQSLLQGGGVHVMFATPNTGTRSNPRYGMVGFGIWQTADLLHAALHDHILPVFTDAFAEFKTKADPDTIESTPLGIGVREEVRTVIS